MTKNEIEGLRSLELSDQIIEVQKYLFNLKLKNATKQSVKNHLFKKYRRILAQLLTNENKFNQ